MKLVAVAVALVSSTCCPSLFLSVEKGRPAPRMPMPEPKIAKTAIQTPSYLRNRFLDKRQEAAAPNARKVLDTQIDRFGDYTDMPRETNQLVRALNSLEELEDDYGIPRRPRLRLTAASNPNQEVVDGELSCDDRHHCEEIQNLALFAHSGDVSSSYLQDA